VDFRTAVDRLLNQVGHWEQSRWAAAGRADVVYALVQRLADLGADAEHRPRRPVPRLSDLLLPDQLRVMADDLLAADPPAEMLATAVAETDTARRSI
jgi:hypothetical protein